MSLEKAEKAIGTATSFIQLGAQILVGAMMVFFAGLPLVMGGIASGWVPLIIGCLAFANAGRTIWRMVS